MRNSECGAGHRAGKKKIESAIIQLTTDYKKISAVNSTVALKKIATLVSMHIDKSYNNEKQIT